MQFFSKDCARIPGKLSGSTKLHNFLPVSGSAAGQRDVSSLLPRTRKRRVVITMRSSSIPIWQKENVVEELEAKERDRRRMLADAKDFDFCARLVDGMRKQQRDRRDAELKRKNQILIDRIINTRLRDSGDGSRTTTPDRRRLHGRTSSNNNSRSVADPVLVACGESRHDEDCDLIFDMDL